MLQEPEPDWAARLSREELFQNCLQMRVPVPENASRAELIGACDYRDRMPGVTLDDARNACKRVHPDEPVEQLGFVEALQCARVVHLPASEEEEEEEEEETKQERNERVLRVFGLEPVRRLGQGTFGTVYQVRDSLNGESYAAKIIERTDDDVVSGLGAPESAVREATIYRRIPLHPNITRMFRAFYDPGVFDGAVLLLELAGMGDLSSVINSFWAQTPGSSKLRSRAAEQIPRQIRIARDLVCGLAQAHASNIIFIDFKPANALVFDNYQTKLSDLGGAWRTEAGIPFYGLESMSTLWWRSPEELCGATERSNIGFARDMWTLGLIFLQLFFDQLPTEVDDARKLFQQWTQLRGAPDQKWFTDYDFNYTLCPRPSSGMSVRSVSVQNTLPLQYYRNVYYNNPDVPGLFDMIVDLIDSLLNWSPVHRLSADAALQHPLFTKAAVRLGIGEYKCPVNQIEAPPVPESLIERLAIDRHYGQLLTELYATFPLVKVNLVLRLTANIVMRFESKTERKLLAPDYNAAVLIAVEALDYYYAQFAQVIPKEQKAQVVQSQATILRTIDWDIDGSWEIESD